MTAKVRPPLVAQGVVRERLHARLRRLGDGRMGLIVAPAGWGKTTLLAQFAASAGLSTAWYQAEPSDAREGDMLRHLEAAFARAVGPLTGDWSSVEGAVGAVERWGGQRVMLVIDDLHHIEGTHAEAALERFALYAPAGLALIVASRYSPGFNLARLRVSDRLVELDAEDLRFRIWEVERLFRDHYGDTLPPEELAQLARRTEGWAAGLQLFHLATSGRPAVERRRVLDGMASRSRLVREYLTRNVLHELPTEMQEFLVQTSVLGRLSGSLCDRLLRRARSDDVLAEIERRQLFTSALDDSTYRSHEVLRSLLQEILVEREGVAKAQAAHRRAGDLLEEAGAVPEALQAYCRAGDWEAAGRLLGCRGQQAIVAPSDWADWLPPALVDHDPWLLLATARHEALAGRLTVALDRYARAEAAFEGESAAETCRLERLAVRSWTEPAFHHSDDWIGVLRRATARHPLEAVEGAGLLGDRRGQFVAGLAALLAGHFERGAALLAGVDEEAVPLLAAGARIAVAIAARFEGKTGDGPDLDKALDALDANGMGWLARLGRATTEASSAAEVAEMGAAFAADGNTWGAALASFLGGMIELASEEPAPSILLDAARQFRRLGGEVLESWARAAAALALARIGDPTAACEARDAEALARTTGCPGALVLAAFALAEAEPRRRSDHDARARAAARHIGMGLMGVGLRDPSSPPQRMTKSEPATPSVTVRCFGGFRLVVAGVEVDCGAVKPRARSALHLLAAHAGRAVHREVLVDALWPELDVRAGVRSLQVAISTLRPLLESCGGSLLVRVGEAYRLTLPPDGQADVVVFEHALVRARAARGDGRPEAAEAALDAALAAYAGQLLPEEGPADWAVKLRDHYRMEAAAAAHTLAELRLARGDVAGAVAAAEAGLAVDRYRDGLWQLLIAAHRRAGEAAALAAAERRYGETLVELGVATEVDTRS